MPVGWIVSAPYSTYNVQVQSIYRIQTVNVEKQSNVIYCGPFLFCCGCELVCCLLHLLQLGYCGNQPGVRTAATAVVAEAKRENVKPCDDVIIIAHVRING